MKSTTNIGFGLLSYTRLCKTVLPQLFYRIITESKHHILSSYTALHTSDIVYARDMYEQSAKKGVGK